jgi:hypothetical protein
MSQFYQVDSTKVSLREYWWGSRSPLVIIGWILKWLRVRIPSSTDDANTDSTIPFVTPALPLEVQSLFAPLTQELSQLGFYDPVFHVVYDAGSSTTLYWATFLHTSGQHLARIHHRAWGARAELSIRLPYRQMDEFLSAALSPTLAANPAPDWDVFFPMAPSIHLTSRVPVPSLLSHCNRMGRFWREEPSPLSLVRAVRILVA